MRSSYQKMIGENMQIKMLEYFQGTNQPYLEPGKEYESKDIGQKLCEWLLEHNKAIDITPEPEPVKPDITPSALRLVTENNVNIEEVEGTGTDGRILVADVEDYLNSAETENGAETEPLEDEDDADY